MALTGPREMMVEVDSIATAYSDTGLYAAPPDGWGNWDYTKVGSYHWMTQQLTIDVQGLFWENLAIQLEGVAIQKGYNPVVSWGLPPAGPTGRVNLQYYVSSSPMWVTETERLAILGADNIGHTPTFSRTGATADAQDYGLSYQDAMVASNTTFVANSNVGLSSRGWLSVLNSQMYGSNSEFAGRKLYITIMWVIEEEAVPQAIGSVFFPAMRLALAARVYKPKKDNWIKTLMRSIKIAPRRP